MMFWKTGLVAIGLAALLAAGRADATTVVFDSLSGFDNSSLALPEDYEVLNASDWMSAGSGAPLAIQIFENQCLMLMPGDCFPTLPLNAGPYSSEVTWSFQNNSGLAGPGLLFISGLSSAPPYNPSDIGIVLGSARVGDSSAVNEADFTPIDFDIVKYSTGGMDFYYLAYLINDFSVQLRFNYEVDALQLSGGTPELLVNSAFAFVPEPNTALLLGSGLVGLGIIARRRNS